MNQLRVLCFGGREFRDIGSVNKAMDAVHAQADGRPIVIIHGAARGADSLCGRWAAARGLPVMVFPANWTLYDSRAGVFRNQWMLEFGQPNYAVGFPGGAGTRDMAERLTTAGVPIYWPLLS